MIWRFEEEAARKKKHPANRICWVIFYPTRKQKTFLKLHSGTTSHLVSVVDRKAGLLTHICSIIVSVIIALSNVSHVDSKPLYVIPVGIDPRYLPLLPSFMPFWQADPRRTPMTQKRSPDSENFFLAVLIGSTANSARYRWRHILSM